MAENEKKYDVSFNVDFSALEEASAVFKEITGYIQELTQNIEIAVVTKTDRSDWSEISIGVEKKFIKIEKNFDQTPKTFPIRMKGEKPFLCMETVA